LEAREKEIAVLRAEKEALTQAAAEVSGLRQRADLHESAQQRVVELERALGREEGRSAELERESAAFRDSHQKTAAAIADLDTRIAELTRAIEVARRSTGWLSSLRRLIEARGRGSAG
jgi:septal ring factor EnvC (AmiA/AmiB activator)